MEFVKDRIVLCVNNKVYELSPTATGLPSPAYTNPNTEYHYTSVAASGPAIYTAGHSGIYSTIQKYTLSATTGSMPTLSQASVAAEFPAGEIVEKLFYYLGYMCIGTNKGVRIAVVNDQDGSIGYGPIIVETSQPVYDFAGRDRFIWATTGIGALDAGITRIDLGQTVEKEPLRFAYANDLQATQTTTHYTTGVAFLGATSRLAFCTAYEATNGAIYLESETELVPTGYIKTGAIRYGTLENKIFKTLNAIVDNSYGDFVIESIAKDGTAYTIGNFNEGDFTPEVNISYPVGAQQYMSFKFTLKRNSTDTSKGTTFGGYQLKSIPALPRQRLIQFPLACFDREKDSLGNQVGHEGSAYDRLIDLERLENLGDTIRVEDFRTNETYLAIIEELQFINRTPTDKRFSGFGGIILATVRTI
jgi:hypothetical protein